MDEFVAITGASKKQAEKFLKQQNNQLEAALSAFFDSGEAAAGDSAAEVVVAPPIVLPPAVAAPPIVAPVAAQLGPPVVSVQGTTLESISVDAVMEDLTLDVGAVMSFQNKQQAAIEAVFKFRGDEASIYAFEVEIGGKKIVGQCKAKEKALNEYDDSISAGHRGFLLEKEVAGVFSLSLGNLGPGDKCSVSIRYVEDVQLDEQSNALIVIPLVAIAPDKGLASCSVTINDHVKSVVASSGHEIAQEKQGDRKTVVRVSSGGQQRELILVVEPTEKGLPFPTVEDDKNTTAISIAFVPQEMQDEEPMTEVIFLVDRSGSMAGSRMRQTKAALQLMLRSLPTNCFFDLVSFGTSHESVFGRSVEYNAETFKRASAAVDGFDSNMGGTELLRPLTEILSRPDGKFPRQVLLLTDGDVTNTSDVILAAKRVSAKTRVFALGIGSDASPLLIRGVAKAGGGEAKMAPSGERLEPIIASLCARVFRPCISSAVLDWGDLKPSIKFESPKDQGVIFAGQKLTAYAVLFENDKKKHSVSLTVSVAGSSSSKVYRAEVDLAQSRQGQTAHRLAVKALVSDFEAGKAPKDLSKNDITALACKYGIASSLTSLIAVDTTANRAADGSLVQVAGNNEVRDSYGQQQNISKFIDRADMIDDLMAQTATLGADSHMFRASAKKKSGGGFFASVGSAVSGFFGGGGSAPPASASERSAYEGMGNSSLQSKVSESGNRPRTAHAGKRGAEREEASDEAILAARNREIADLDKNLAEMSDLFLEVNGMVQEQGADLSRRREREEQVEELDQLLAPLEERDSRTNFTRIEKTAEHVQAQNARVSKALKDKPSRSLSRSPSPVEKLKAAGPPPPPPAHRSPEAAPAGRGSGMSSSSSSSKSAPSPARKKGAVDPNARPLDLLVRLCSFDGLFDLSDELADICGSSLIALQKAKPENLSEATFATVIAIELLRSKFSELKQEWVMLEKKSLKALGKIDYEAVALVARQFIK